MKCPLCNKEITAKELNDYKRDIGVHRQHNFWVCPRCDRLIFITSSAH